MKSGTVTEPSEAVRSRSRGATQIQAIQVKPTAKGTRSNQDKP